MMRLMSRGGKRKLPQIKEKKNFLASRDDDDVPTSATTFLFQRLGFFFFQTDPLLFSLRHIISMNGPDINALHDSDAAT